MLHAWRPCFERKVMGHLKLPSMPFDLLPWLAHLCPWRSRQGVLYGLYCGTCLFALVLAPSKMFNW